LGPFFTWISAVFDSSTYGANCLKSLVLYQSDLAPLFLPSHKQCSPIFIEQKGTTNHQIQKGFCFRRSMESSRATLGGILAKVSEGTGRNRRSGFWGESTRGSGNTRFLSVQSCKTSRTSKNLRNSKPRGVARAVLTSDINEDSVVNQQMHTHHVLKEKFYSLWCVSDCFNKHSVSTLNRSSSF